MRVDSDVKGYASGSYIACVVDPFGLHYGGLTENNYHYAKTDLQCEFVARLFDINVLVPMVKVVEVSKYGTVVTVETNDGVEFYQPEV